MAESVDEFLARGGKVQELEPTERTYRDENAFRRAHKRKQDEENYTDFQMRQAENETHCKKPGNI